MIVASRVSTGCGASGSLCLAALISRPSVHHVCLSTPLSDHLLSSPEDDHQMDQQESYKAKVDVTDLTLLLRGLRGIQEGRVHRARLDWQVYLVPWDLLDHLDHQDPQDHRIVVD